MLTTEQLQLLRLQRVNQNAASVAMMVYRRLIRRRRRQYWLRPWISGRPQLGDYENLMAELERESHALALALQTWPSPVGCLLAEAFLFSANFCVLRNWSRV